MTVALQSSKPVVRDSENLSGRVYNQIRKLVSCHEVLPRRKLYHQEPGDRPRASRTPVREALTRLVQEGYVSFLPNRGFTRKEISLQEAEGLYDLGEAVKGKKERKKNGSRFSYQKRLGGDAH
jgi:DNA-binding GntR family transcriptional regulator